MSLFHKGDEFSAFVRSLVPEDLTAHREESRGHAPGRVAKEWLVSRKRLLDQQKTLTRARHAINAEFGMLVSMDNIGRCRFKSINGGPQMHEPLTTIDERFSDPDAAATPWDDTRRELEDAELFWITTVRSDGRPHVTPLVAVWLDGAIHFCTGHSEQKAINLRRNPHVILTTGCNRWDRGLDVVVEGDAVRVTDPDMLRRLAQAWTAKWDGRWQFAAGSDSFHHQGGGAALVFSVTPTKILAFGKGNFSHTRHRF
jgi:general stress protein 26